MSGGTWNRLYLRFEGRAEELRYAAEAMELLAAIEHELDLGQDGAKCYECAKLRTIAARSIANSAKVSEQRLQFGASSGKPL